MGRDDAVVVAHSLTGLILPLVPAAAHVFVCAQVPVPGVRAVDRLLAAGSYVALATHDRALIEEVLAVIERRLVSREGYEFQMLLGVAEDVRHRLVAAGHRVRVYVPFGNAWYAYSVRRLKENPSIAGYVARDVMRSFVPGLR